MPPFRLCGRSDITFAFAFVLAASGTPAEPREARDADRPQRSVRGTPLSVNHRTNTVVMKSDDGQNLSWRLGRDVVKEAEGSEEGHPMIVIYRQLSGNVKRVTAVAFPGAEKTPSQSGHHDLVGQSPC
jgi:hypothetical protein